MAGIIESQTAKIMRGGIKRFAESLKIDKKDVQIQVRFHDGNIAFFKCQAWQPIEQVKFRDILGAPDLMGFSNIAVPFMAESLEKFASEFQSDIDALRVFIHEAVGEDSKKMEMHICVYEIILADEGPRAEEKKNIPLSEHFAKMGVE